MKTILTALCSGLLMMTIMTNAGAATCIDDTWGSGGTKQQRAAATQHPAPVVQQKAANHRGNAYNQGNKQGNKHYYRDGHGNKRYFSNNNGNRRYYTSGNRQYYYRNGVRVYR